MSVEFGSADLVLDLTPVNTGVAIFWPGGGGTGGAGWRTGGVGWWTGGVG